MVGASGAPVLFQPAGTANKRENSKRYENGHKVCTGILIKKTSLPQSVRCRKHCTCSPTEPEKAEQLKKITGPITPSKT